VVGWLKIGSIQLALYFFVLTERGPIIFAGSFGMKPHFRLWNEAGSHADWGYEVTEEERYRDFDRIFGFETRSIRNVGR